MGRVNNTVDKFGRQRGNQQYVQLVRGLPGIGFKLTSNEQYDIEGKSLTNVGPPKNNNDATTREYVINELREVRKEIFSTINKDMVKYLNNRVHHFEGNEKKIVDAAIMVDYMNKQILELRQEVLSIVNNDNDLRSLRDQIKSNEETTHTNYWAIDARLKKMEDQIKSIVNLIL